MKFGLVNLFPPEVQEDVNKQILTALLGSMEGTESARALLGYPLR